MKVLHVVSISFSLKYFIGNQFTFFRDKGIDYTVACSPSEDLYIYSEKMDFKVFPLKVLRTINPITDFLSIYKLYKFIKKEKFDFVICHSPKGGLIGGIASFLAQTPSRFFFRHGLVFETERGLKKYLLINVEKIIGNCNHKIVNVSNSIIERTNELGLNKPTKNIILKKGSCNGVDIKTYCFRDKIEFKNNFVVGFIGRLCNDKGVVELIKSLDYLEKYPEIIFLLIGPLDTRDQLSEEFIERIKKHPQVVYKGEVDNTFYFYNQMDVFILPSYREGFPTVNLEASASKIPVITTRKTGCVDSIIDGVTGIYTEINPLSIAKSIEFYFNNKDFRTLHGINGRKFVEENFTEDLIYEEIENKIFKWKS